MLRCSKPVYIHENENLYHSLKHYVDLSMEDYLALEERVVVTFQLELKRKSQHNASLFDRLCFGLANPFASLNAKAVFPICMFTSKRDPYPWTSFDLRGFVSYSSVFDPELITVQSASIM